MYNMYRACHYTTRVCGSVRALFVLINHQPQRKGSSFFAFALAHKFQEISLRHRYDHDGDAISIRS
jgi:hypothetical protein